MLGLINRLRFRNSSCVPLIGIIPPRFQFDQGNRVGTIAINFVRGHENEWRVGAVTSGGFKQVQRSASVDIEILEGYPGGKVMAGLCSAVHYERWSVF